MKWLIKSEYTARIKKITSRCQVEKLKQSFKSMQLKLYSSGKIFSFFQWVKNYETHKKRNSLTRFSCKFCHPKFLFRDKLKPGPCTLLVPLKTSIKNGWLSCSWRKKMGTGFINNFLYGTLYLVFVRDLSWYWTSFRHECMI